MSASVCDSPRSGTGAVARGDAPCMLRFDQRVLGCTFDPHRIRERHDVAGRGPGVVDALSVGIPLIRNDQ
jgi:hypothetical protein